MGLVRQWLKPQSGGVAWMLPLGVGVRAVCGLLGTDIAPALQACRASTIRGGWRGKAPSCHCHSRGQQMTSVLQRPSCACTHSVACTTTTARSRRHLD